VSYTENSDEDGPRPLTKGCNEFNTLSFYYNLEPNDEVYFCSYPPYTYTMLCSFLARLSLHSNASNHFIKTELDKTLLELSVPLLIITEDAKTLKPSNSQCGSYLGLGGGRRLAAIIARQHPGEGVGSFAMQGFLRFLLGQSPAALRLRHEFVFHVVPMVNVDGVVYGNSRCTYAGYDPNRAWRNPNSILNPVVHTIKAWLYELAKTNPNGLEFFYRYAWSLFQERLLLLRPNSFLLAKRNLSKAVLAGV
jgi:hypothetical protein